MNNEELEAYQIECANQLARDMATVLSSQTAASHAGPLRAVIQKLAVARINAGLTQTDLAKKVGCTQAYIAKLENYKGNPSLTMLLKIAEALSVRITFVSKL